MQVLNQRSDLVEIASHNGDFWRNYGALSACSFPLGREFGNSEKSWNFHVPPARPRV